MPIACSAAPENGADCMQPITRAVLCLATAMTVATASGPLLAGPTVLLNDTLNGENGGNGAAEYSGFANFSASNVDLLAPGYFFNLCQAAGDNSTCIDMEGSGNGSLTTKTAYTFAPGGGSVQFDLAGSQRGSLSKTVTVSVVTTLGDTLFSEPFTLASDAQF